MFEDSSLDGSDVLVISCLIEVKSIRKEGISLVGHAGMVPKEDRNCEIVVDDCEIVDRYFALTNDVI